MDQQNLHYSTRTSLNLPSFHPRFPEDEPKTEAQICQNFIYWAEDKHTKFTVLKNRNTKKVSRTSQWNNTRFSEKGKQRRKDRIKKRYGGINHNSGILLTLTIAPALPESLYYHGMTREQAWANIGRLGRDFLDRLQKKRKEWGWVKLRFYLRVNEIQEQTLYPHIHIWFPNMKYLFPIKVIQKLWPWGNVDISKAIPSSASDYLLKYTAKSDQSDFSNAMLWGHRLRLYSTSRSLPSVPFQPPFTGWTFHSAGGHYRTIEEVQQLVDEGYSFSGPQTFKLRGS